MSGSRWSTLCCLVTVLNIVSARGVSYGAWRRSVIDKDCIGEEMQERTAHTGNSRVARESNDPSASVVGMSSDTGRIIARDIDCNLILSDLPSLPQYEITKRGKGPRETVGDRVRHRYVWVLPSSSCRYSCQSPPGITPDTSGFMVCVT